MLFYQRLGDAPWVNTHGEPYALIRTTLDAVEDEYSGVPNDPENWQTDGRLYPPQADQAYAVDGFSEVVRYRNSKHDTFIASNGAIKVKVIKTSVVDFMKLGADGKGVWE